MIIKDLLSIAALPESPLHDDFLKLGLEKSSRSPSSKAILRDGKDHLDLLEHHGIKYQSAKTGYYHRHNYNYASKTNVNQAYPKLKKYLEEKGYREHPNPKNKVPHIYIHPKSGDFIEVYPYKNMYHNLSHFESVRQKKFGEHTPGTTPKPKYWNKLTPSERTSFNKRHGTSHK